MASAGGRLVGILAFELRGDGTVVGLRTLANPDKLAFAAAQWMAA